MPPKTKIMKSSAAYTPWGTISRCKQLNEETVRVPYTDRK